MPDMVAVDAWMLLGALVQLVLILRARNFYLKDWLLPVFSLVGGSLFWFFFIRAASGNQGFAPAAETFFIGFAMAMGGAAFFLSAFAPMRLNSATLLSLTLSFWAVYLNGGVERGWLAAAIPMTVASIAFIAGRGRGLLPFRASLQIWALAAAALVAYDAIPSSVGKVIWDYRVEELARGLNAFEALVAGAQAFLLTQMGMGLIMLISPETWTGWLPMPGEEKTMRWPAIAALVSQAVVFVWLEKSGGRAESQFMIIAVFAALAHGAMTGPDAKPSRPVVDFAALD